MAGDYPPWNQLFWPPSSERVEITATGNLTGDLRSPRVDSTPMHTSDRER